jgi:hypothetical protein
MTGFYSFCRLYGTLGLWRLVLDEVGEIFHHLGLYCVTIDLESMHEICSSLDETDSADIQALFQQ